MANDGLSYRPFKNAAEWDALVEAMRRDREAILGEASKEFRSGHQEGCQEVEDAARAADQRKA